MSAARAIALSDAQRQLILTAADHVAPTCRWRFLQSVIDALGGLADIADADVERIVTYQSAKMQVSDECL